MTILTKSLAEKQPDKVLAEPLFNQEELPPPPPYNPDYAPPPPNCSHVRVYDGRRRLRIWHLIFAILIVILSGILAGMYLYRQYSYPKAHHFKTWCGVPLMGGGRVVTLRDPEYYRMGRPTPEREEASNGADFESQVFRDMFRTSSRAMLQEEVDLDTDTDEYEKIEVPDFSDGRPGRFVHDFSKNITGIVDLEAKRCFVMPLNHTMVLRPRSLFDVISRMMHGVFDVDTRIVRQQMRVVLPALTDIERNYGSYVASECERFPTYRLEKMTRPIYRRSVRRARAVPKRSFVEFAGQKVSQIEIVNLDSLERVAAKH